MEVVIRSERGVEVGQVLCESTEDELSHLDQPPSGTIVRAVGDDDAVAIDAIEATRLKEISTCKKHVESLGLDMKLIEVERLLGGQRMVVCTSCPMIALIFANWLNCWPLNFRRVLK